MTTSLKRLRWTALAEATSFLALLVATYLKHSGHGGTGVQVLGPIHGLLFVAYVFLVVTLRPEAGWSNRTTGWILVGAVVPFGGYAVDRWLARQPAPQLSSAG